MRFCIVLSLLCAAVTCRSCSHFWPTCGGAWSWCVTVHHELVEVDVVVVAGDEMTVIKFKLMRVREHTGPARRT
jgi:hypothetical protein